MYPYNNPSLITKGLSILKNLKWGTVLDGTQKTLGVINQAIPIFYQVKPIVNNAKTLFKVANIMNTPEEKTTQNKKTDNISPVFYL